MDAPKPTGWFRTESGTVLEMDLPLLDGIAHRVKTGDIVQVANAAGDPLPDPDHPLVPASEADELREQLAEAVDDNELLTKQLQDATEANADLAGKLAAAETERDDLAQQLEAALAKPDEDPASKPAKKAAAKPA